jgi:hypothetical protein
MPPPRVPSTAHYDPNAPQLPTGAFSALTIGMGLAIGAGGFFALRGLNHLFAMADDPALYRVYPPIVVWLFAPGLAALAMPWPLGLLLIRKLGYVEDAERIVNEGNAKSGFDCERVMWGMVWLLAVPVIVATVLELPSRVTLTETEILHTHYASLRPERFSYADARRATLIDGGKARDGSFYAQPDLILDFADGRRFLTSTGYDGGRVPTAAEARLLLEKTHLVPGHAKTVGDIPPLH